LPLQSNSGRHPTPLFWYLGFHGNAILNFINMPKTSTHYGEYSYDVSRSLMREIKKFLNPPPLFFLFPWQLRQSLSYRFRFFLAYLIPLDVGVTGNITAKICEACSELKKHFFALWLPWKRPPF
jgi:hypothetical protein